MNLGEIELEKVCLSQSLKILGLFVNTLTAEYMYSCREYADFHATSSDAIILSAWKGLLFLDFLLPFWNLHEMENFFKKKESLLAYSAFRNLLTPKEVVT